MEFFYTKFLRDCCRDCGIKVGETKADLIDRLCKVDSDTEHVQRQVSVDQLEAIAEEIEHSSGNQISWESEYEAVFTLTETIDRNTGIKGFSTKK